MSKFTFPVSQLRTFSYPDGKKRILAEARIADLPRELPTEINAREQNLRTGVARAIRRSLNEDYETFHLLNRGIVIMVESAEFDNVSRELTIGIRDPETHGVLDGGHTYRIVLEEAESRPDARVLLEILVGVEDCKTEIVGARNTSLQVDEVSRLNVDRQFDPILDYLDCHGLSRDRIKVKMNEPKEIPMLDILAIMYLFDVDSFGNDMDGFGTPPILAFTGKGSITKHFKSNPETFTKKILPLLPDILWLWDYVAFRLQDHYRKGMGRELGRVGGRRGMGTGTFPGTFMPDLQIKHIMHRAYRLPIIAATRCLVDNAGSVYTWKPVNPPPVSEEIENALGRPATLLERFYESIAVPMNRALWQEAENSNPTRLGKQAMLWNNLYMIALRGLINLSEA